MLTLFSRVTIPLPLVWAALGNSVIMSASFSAPPPETVAQKWRALAERRRAHFVELYRSGRWQRYYTRDEFAARLREVIDAADTWAKLAPNAASEQPSA